MEAHAGEMPETITCPYCAEEIRAAAVRCKHCRADLAARPLRRGLFLAVAIGIAASLLPPLLGAALAPDRAPRPVPAALDACPSDLGAMLPPGHPPVPGTGTGRGLPAWHPPIDGRDLDAGGAPFPQDGARTL
jgi:hypothetical protein